jgi:hypothetical protein
MKTDQKRRLESLRKAMKTDQKRRLESLRHSFCQGKCLISQDAPCRAVIQHAIQHFRVDETAGRE